MILDGLADRQALRQIALMLDRRPVQLTDAELKEMSGRLREIAGEPYESAGHRASCSSLKVRGRGDCDCGVLTSEASQLQQSEQS